MSSDREPPPSSASTSPSAAMKKTAASSVAQPVMDESTSSTIVTHAPLSRPPPPLSHQLPCSSSTPSSSSSSPSLSSSSSVNLAILADDEKATSGQLLLFGSGAYGMMADIPTASSSSPSSRLSGDEGNVYLPSVVPALSSTRIASVSLGSTHALLTTDEGVTLAFGDNSNGELGLPAPPAASSGASTVVSTPTPVPGLASRYVISTSTGYNHSAVVTARGDLLTFGNGELGQLGVNTSSTGIHRWDLSSHPSPVLVQQLSGVKIVKVVTGDEGSIALSDTGLLFACGDAHRGTLGLEQGLTWNEDRHRVGYFTPVTALSPLPIVDIAAGSHHTLALTATGEVYSFGQGRRGQLGHGGSNNVFLPKRVEGLERLRCVRVYAGGDSSAVLSEDGELYVFGNNAHGQLGVGDRDSRYVPVRVKDALEGRRVVKAALGHSHMIALCDDHTVWGAGDASLGALGLGVKGEEMSEAADNAMQSEDGGGKRQKMSDDEDGSSGSGYDDVLTPTLIRLPAGRRVIDIAAGSTSSAVILSFSSSVAELPRIAFPTSLSSFPILHFDSAVFSHLIDTSRQNGSYAPLLAYINRIFSSPSVLNASFLPASSVSLSLPSSLVQRQLSLTSIDPVLAATTLPNSLLSPAARVQPAPIAGGIDVQAVEDVYKAVLRESMLEPKLVTQVQHTIQRCIHSMLERMKQPHPPADAAAYRAVAICLQAPFLSAASDSDVQVLADIAQIVSRMGPAVRKAVRRWLTSYSPEIFGSRLVRMLIAAITAQLRAQRLSLASSVAPGQPVPRVEKVNDEVQAMVRLLSLMKEASELAGGLISDDKWHIPIAKFISLEHDFIAFITRQPTQAMMPPFSFCRFPFTLDPATKTAYLRIEHYSHQRSSIYTALQSEQMPFVTLRVERARLVESTVNELNRHSTHELQRPLRVEFIGEEGVDQGGVSAEFFRLAVAGMMGPQYGLFDYNPELRHLWWNHAEPDPSKQDLYYLCGTLLGLAAYNAHSINISFPAIFYKQLLNTPVGDDNNGAPAASATSPASAVAAASSSVVYTLADLHSLDPRLVQSLQQLLAYDAADMEDVFSLTFTVDVEVRRHGRDGEEIIEIKTEELLEGGASVPVTQSNKAHYCTLLTRFLLSSSIATQQQAFVRGFRSVCQGRAMSLYSPTDLQQLLIGQPTYDWKAMQTTARYEGGYRQDSDVVRWLWQAVETDLTLDERLRLLVFLTGSSRPPLGGLAELRVIVQRAGVDSEQVPTASTCFHCLLLPEYSSKEKLIRKLRKALEYTEGFGLQ